MSAPLTGVKVLDFSELLPGPFLSECLVEMGADVVKIERPPHGDGLRSSSPGLFEIINRGKGSIALNLKDTKDQEIAKEALKNVDIMIEGFRPGVMKRLGLGYEEVKACNPEIIYLSLSGYGQTGPMVKAPGHDLNYLALAGVTSLCGDPEGSPEHTFGLPVADLGGALYGLSAILAALFQKTATGRGQYLDLSITDCLAHWVNSRRGPFNHNNVRDLSEQRRMALVRPAYGVFACLDGAVSIAALEGHFWSNLKNALGLEEFNGKKFETLSTRREQADAINNSIAKLIAVMSRDDAVALMDKFDVPASPVLSVDEAAISQHFTDRNLIVETKAGSATPFPVRLSGMKFDDLQAPKLGAGGNDP